ncbi:hypothetical protein J6590_039842 [Homalodisca vitripennis]|nr:hypothetical protein J6590_039842 [Homalodisca vitripennis]
MRYSAVRYIFQCSTARPFIFSDPDWRGIVGKLVTTSNLQNNDISRRKDKTRTLESLALLYHHCTGRPSEGNSANRLRRKVKLMPNEKALK